MVAFVRIRPNVFLVSGVIHPCKWIDLHRGFVVFYLVSTLSHRPLVIFRAQKVYSFELDGYTIVVEWSHYGVIMEVNEHRKFLYVAKGLGKHTFSAITHWHFILTHRKPLSSSNFWVPLHLT